MKPGFALSLSFEGITLLYRTASGWRRVGEVPVDTSDMAAAMDGLRRGAAALTRDALRSKIVLPNDQIRYLTIETGALPAAARRDAAARALDGATPYAVDELAFDIAADGPRTHVAAVAKETLAEAEAFAVEHRFDPVSFVARPEDGDFPGEPFFGETEHAETILTGDERVEPDNRRIELAERSEVPDGPVVPETAQPTPPPPAMAEAPEPAGQAAPKAPALTPGEAAKAAPPPPAASAVQAADRPAAPAEDDGDPPGGFASRRARPGGEALGDVTAMPRASSAEIVPIPPHQRTPPPPARPAPTVAAPQSRAPAQQFTSARAASLRAPGVPASAPSNRVATPGPSSGPASGTMGAQRTAPAPEPATAEPRAGFMSRRRTKVTPPTPAPDPIPDMPGSDAERMPVFGARQQAKPRGKPRFLGLIMTVVLLVLLVGVAAFAAIFNDTPVSQLFGRDSDQADTAELFIDGDATETDAAYAPATDTPATGPDAPDTAALDPRILGMPAEVVPQSDGETGGGPADIATDAPLLAAPETGDEADPLLGSDPDADVAATRDNDPLELADTLTDADAAVLDALRAPDQPDAATDAIGAADEDFAGLDPEELADAPLPEMEAPDLPADSAEATAASYAATGIWSSAPDTPSTPGVISLDDLFVAAIDGATLTQDALALPAAQSYDTDISPNGVASPAAAGIAFELDALGLVEPSEDGTITPDGIVVFLGQPPSVPPPTPPRVEAIVAQEPLSPVLPATRPRGRPGDLVENAERSRLGGLTLDELGGLRPRERPYEPEVPEPAPVEDDVAEVVAEAVAEAIEEAPAEPDYIPLRPDEMHLAAKKPQARPSNFARTVAQAQAAQPRRQASTSAGPAAAASTASTATALAQPSTSNRAGPAVARSEQARPTGPTPSSVARQATIKNAINLRQVNLVGVYGSPSNRRALIRLSSGRYKKVQVGDRIDGGQIVAIGDSELRYQKGGRNVVLKIPSG